MVNDTTKDNNNNNNVYFKLVYRLNDNNIYTSYGLGIKAVIYYIFTITDTSLRTRKSSDKKIKLKSALFANKGVMLTFMH